tara:strand:- start:262 stop:552 length:291 start_codon:yes stop_codon:yes gene_type:complete
MDVSQIFATGGVSSLAISIVYIIFKFLQSRRHLASNCSRNGVSIVADAGTPKIKDKINPIVVEKECLPEPHTAQALTLREPQQLPLSEELSHKDKV